MSELFSKIIKHINLEI